LTNIQNTIDALIKLDDLVNNTELLGFEVQGYLSDFEFVGNVKFPFLQSTVLKGETIKLNIDKDKESFFEDKSILSDDFWGKYFIKQDKLFSISKHINIAKDNDDNAFLVKEYVDEQTAVSNLNALSFENLNTSRTDLSIEMFERNSNMAIPLEFVKKIVPTLFSKNLFKFDIEKLNAHILLGNNSSVIKIMNQNLFLNEFNLKSFVMINKNIVNLDKELDVDKLKTKFLIKSSSISNDVVVPEDAETNIYQFNDLYSLPYIKAGDQVLFSPKEYTELDDLNKIIEGFYSSTPEEIGFDDNRIVSKDNLDAVILKMISYYTVN